MKSDDTSTFLVASAALPLPLKSSGRRLSIPSVITTPSHKQSSKNTGPDRLSTATFDLLPTPKSGTNSAWQWNGSRTKKSVPLSKRISSLEASPASPSPKPDEGSARKTTAISGRRCYELYGSFIRGGSSVKTLAVLLLGAEVWYSNKCTLTWKVKATKSSRLLFQLSPSTHRTEEIGSGLLPTTATRDYKGANSPAHLAKERGHHDQLPNVIAMLPTPTLQMISGGAVEAHQTEDGWKRTSKQGKDHGANLHDVVKTVGEKTGLKLQPAFALWMMGYPTDWLDLEDGEMPPSKARAMRSSPKSQQKS